MENIFKGIPCYPAKTGYVGLSSHQPWSGRQMEQRKPWSGLDWRRGGATTTATLTFRGGVVHPFVRGRWCKNPARELCHSSRVQKERTYGGGRGMKTMGLVSCSELAWNVDLFAAGTFGRLERFDFARQAISLCTPLDEVVLLIECKTQWGSQMIN